MIGPSCPHTITCLVTVPMPYGRLSFHLVLYTTILNMIIFINECMCHLLWRHSGLVSHTARCPGRCDVIQDEINARQSRTLLFLEICLLWRACTYHITFLVITDVCCSFFSQQRSWFLENLAGKLFSGTGPSAWHHTRCLLTDCSKNDDELHSLVLFHITSCACCL